MGRSDSCRRRLFLKAWISVCMLLNAITPQAAEESLTQCEIETIFRELTNPNPEYQMHVASLRNQLRSLLGRRIAEDNSLDSENDSFESDKRSIGSLARDGLLSNGKRYIGSLARSDSLRSQLDTIKRSIATLAKNGQLPSRDSDYNDSVQQMGEKRNLGSVARSGYLAGKRNIGSLARDFQLPASSAGKRNLASLAREGLVTSTTPKRNMASLARIGALPALKREPSFNYWPDEWNSEDFGKRNLGALKSSPVHGNRQRRDIGDDFEVPDPVYQNSLSSDYEDLKNAMNQVYNTYYGGTGREEKRFLGSVARSGWYQYRPEKRNLQSLARNGMLRSDLTRYVSGLSGRDLYRQQEQKRHIGSVARSGWLPAFRPIRSGRFSRSGRARTDSSSHKSDFDNPSWATVGDATSEDDYYPTPLVGVLLDYKAPGVHHHDSRHYTGEAYDELNHIINSIDHNDNINNNNNNYYDSYSHLPDMQSQHLQQSLLQKLDWETEQDNRDNAPLDYTVYNIREDNSPNDDDDEDNGNYYQFHTNSNYMY